MSAGLRPESLLALPDEAIVVSAHWQGGPGGPHSLALLGS